MKDLRFTGHLNGAYIDVTFRTDMINADDEFFNITQIMEGREFTPSDMNDPDGQYLKYFSETFKRTNNSRQTAYQFGIDNGLGLRMYHADGTVTTLINDGSNSASA